MTKTEVLFALKRGTHWLLKHQKNVYLNPGHIKVQYMTFRKLLRNGDIRETHYSKYEDFYIYRHREYKSYIEKVANA